MNLDHPHLAPQAAALMNMTDDLRIRAIRTDRWIGFSRAKFALERLQFLCEHPPSTRPPGLAIYAHSGMGKTMLVEKFRRTNPPTVDTVAGVETVPVLSISLSSKPSERRIYAQLLSSSGASLRHAMTLVEMEVRALSILKQLKVRVIVIDEVHNLLAGSPREQRVILQLFRHLSNELKASLVFLGIADAREAIAGDTQLSRRLVAGVTQIGVAKVPLQTPMTQKPRRRRPLVSEYFSTQLIKRTLSFVRVRPGVCAGYEKYHQFGDAND